MSTSSECYRPCDHNTPPKICYYHFTLEYYTVLGRACEVCTPNSTNQFTGECQCVLADGVEKGILTANRMIPGPSIQVCKGDKIVIDVKNQIQGIDVTIHSHGVWQVGTPYSDGVPFVTQCPIYGGNSFRCTFLKFLCFYCFNFMYFIDTSLLLILELITGTHTLLFQP